MAVGIEMEGMAFVEEVEEVAAAFDGEAEEPSGVPVCGLGVVVVFVLEAGDSNSE